MCIILYKPAGVDFPNKSILETCFSHNRDGAGFMYPAKDGVHIQKGFMTFKDFYKALKPHKSKDIPMVCHFRISTHCGVIPEMTQPFPVTGKTKKLKALESVCRVGIAHNGIIPMTMDAKEMSDTALFVKRYANLLITDEKYYENPRISEIIEELIDSRMCILSKDGHAEILGKGWTQDKGVWYSNTSYKPYTYRYTSSANKQYTLSPPYGWGLDSYTDDWYDTYHDVDEDDVPFELTPLNSDVPPEEDDEASVWKAFREECEERYATDGASCYTCPYQDDCYMY